MKKRLLSIIVFFISLNCFPQIEFEKGYFITDQNERIECLIKNVDWRNNPSDFIYKLTDISDAQTADIQSVKEFGIYDISKYIKAVINIDRSGEDLSKLSIERNPVFQKEKLFLKVMVEGQASLFIYEEKNLTRFFYSIDNSAITQLVYKMYTRDGREILYNVQFRQQLLTDLTCPDISIQDIESLDYYENELLRFFVKYNECQNSSFINYKEKHKRDLFNLNVRPGMNISSLSIENPVSDAEDADFGTKLTFRAGIEFEIIFPFNKSKWALLVEPTFQYFKSVEESEGMNDQEVKVNYKSIEVPVGIRHYFYLDEKSSIFINGFYVLDFCFDSTIKYELGWEYEISTIGCFAIGVGYKYSRFSAEIRYLTNRNVLTGYSIWDSDYNTFSVILGYSIF